MEPKIGYIVQLPSDLGYSLVPKGGGNCIGYTIKLSLLIYGSHLPNATTYFY